MTILESLERHYGRLVARGEADAPGYSRESIGFCIWFESDGTIAEVSDLHDYSGKQPVARRMSVPRAVIRTSGISSNFLWDKTAYALGVTAPARKRTALEHAAFKTLHQSRLAVCDDEGLSALCAFLASWSPDQFYSDPRFTMAMIDKNVVFGLIDGRYEFLHNRRAARALIGDPIGDHQQTGICLVTGQRAAIARLHPAIKGVDGAQSSGARLVSFAADAFTSYGSEGGANAPVSEAAAFRYGTALNRLLDRGSRNRLRIGDGTVVYWADATGISEDAAVVAEKTFAALSEPPADLMEGEKLRQILTQMGNGRSFQEMAQQLRPEVRFYVLGLAPNAGRLSVRYWLDSQFGSIAAALAKHFDDIAIQPAPWGERLPSIRFLLVKTVALMEKVENIPPRLAAELTRSALEGLPYPRAMLAVALMRLRAGDPPDSGWHAALIKAYINRLEKDKLPVSRDPDFPAISYQLGRLFAVLGAAQYAALGRVNGSIVDRYFRSASVTPARVFGPLLCNARNHVAAANKRGKGMWIEARLNEILTKLPPDIPTSLKLTDQGRFVVGYYHERTWRGPGTLDSDVVEPATDGTY